MSQLQITNAGIDYRNAVFAGEEVQNITHFVFANLQGQDANAAIDPNTTIPNSLVHSQPIKAVSKVDGNAIVMSAVLGYDIGDFEYNWYGVVATKANNQQVLIAVVTTETQNKIKTMGPVTGNYSVKSVLWRSQNIAAQLNITLNALPWQVQEGELVSRADFDSHNHDEQYLKLSDTTYIPTGAKVPKYDSSKDLNARLFRSEYPNQDSIGGALAFRVESGERQTGADNFIRFCSDVNAIRSWLDVHAKSEINSSYRHREDGIFDRIGTTTIEASGSDLAAAASFRSNSTDTFITFHCGGVFAFNFGFSKSLGKPAIGGWSMGNNVYELYHGGNLPPTINNLTSTSTATPLAANQGKVLKGLIDNLATIVSSDDTTLDQIQEIVNFIKQNKATLDTLTVSNIAGLQNALDALTNAVNSKLSTSGTAANSAKLENKTVAQVIEGTTIRHYIDNAKALTNGGVVTVDLSNIARIHKVIINTQYDVSLVLAGASKSGDSVIIDKALENTGSLIISGKTILMPDDKHYTSLPFSGFGSASFDVHSATTLIFEGVK